MSTRRWKGFFIVLILAMVAAGCSSGNNGQQPSTGGQNGNAEEPKPITLTFWGGTFIKGIEGYGANYGDWETAKAREFQELYPHVTIEVTTIPNKDIEQKVNVAVAGNTPPDILYDNVPLRVIRHAYNGVLEPLDDVVKDDRDDWKDDYLAMGSFEDSVYAIPLYSFPNMVFLNKEIFDRKGVPVPADRKWTWEQMRDALSQVVDNDVYGTAYFAKNEQADQIMIDHLLSAGASWTGADNEHIVNSPEGVEALEFMLSLADEGLIAPGTATMDSVATLELFKQGKLAVLHYLPNQYETFELGKSDGSVVPTLEPYGIIPVFKEGVTPKVTVTGENGFAVFKQEDEEKRKMALEFVKFLLQPDHLQSIVKTTYGIPARHSVKLETPSQDYTELYTELSKLEVVDLNKSAPYYNPVRQAFYPEMQAAFLKSKTPKQALDDFVSKANELAGASRQ